MNRSQQRTIITISIILVISIIALVIWQVIASHHKLTIKDNGITANFYQVIDSKETNTKSIKADQTKSVKNGEYCIAPTDTMYDISPVCVAVDNKDTTLTLNPAYSTDYLAGLLTDSLATELTGIISDKYQAIISGYTVDRGQLFDRGEWYATTLTTIVGPQDRGDVYRVVLQKKDNAWTIAAAPQLVLSKYEYPTIPFTVLTGANQLPGSS